MINCKIAVPELCACNTVRCCFFCDRKDTCEDACVEMKETCAEQVEEETDLQVMQSAVPEAIQVITNITVQMKKMEEQSKRMKEQLVEAMEKYGVKKFENDQVSFTYVPETSRTTVDSTKLKKLYPDIASECSKISSVKASVRISVKG